MKTLANILINAGTICLLPVLYVWLCDIVKDIRTKPYFVHKYLALCLGIVIGGIIIEQTMT